MIKRIACIAFLTFLFNSSFAQERSYRYWIELTNKDSVYSIQRPLEFLSEKAIARRAKYHIAITQTDLPVSSTYVNQVLSLGFRVRHKSKWLNALMIQTRNKKLIDSLAKFPFVKSIKSLGELSYADDDEKVKSDIDINEAISVLESKFDNGKNKKPDTNFYGKSYTQVSTLNVHKLHQMGYMGQGVTVGIIDAGFKNANKLPVFKYAFDSNHVKGAKDFVNRRGDVFNEDDHGMTVWSCIGAYEPYQLVGTSPKADFWLLRSENTVSESPVEEAYWVVAAEFADSVGVDIISSSLGYTEFDDKNLSHTYKELDGKTTLISRAASIAASKGILLVNSAGNEGDNEWKYIGAPADASNIMTVGSVDDQQMYASFSSIGPSSDKRVKPNVVAQGEGVWVASSMGTFYQGNGTSYSCPIMAGAATCLLQANPSRSNSEIITAIQKSASQYYAPDKYLGYGIPDMMLANRMLGGDSDFSLKKDAVLDARVLQDKKIHITIHARTSQKMKIVVENIRNAKGKPLIKDIVDCKTPGVTRVGIGAIQKLPKGTYAIYVYTKDGVSSIILNNN